MDSRYFNSIKCMIIEGSCVEGVENYINDFFMDRTEAEELELIKIAVKYDRIYLLKMFEEYFRFPHDPRLLIQLTNSLETIRFLANRENCQEDMLEDLVNKKDLSEDDVEFLVKNMRPIEDTEWLENVIENENDPLILGRIRHIAPQLFL